MNAKEKIEIINKIFSPSAPIKNITLFSGRQEQISQVGEAILEPGRHIILYGRRGSGKSSFANICSNVFPNHYFIKVNCTRTDNFYSLWEKVLKKVKFYVDKYEVGFNRNKKEETISLSLPAKEYFDADDLIELLDSIDASFFIIFDEFDRISDADTKVMTADAIKSFSDNAENITLMIAGIAQNIRQLLGHHPSLERCIKQIHLDEFSQSELYNIINVRLDIAEMEMDEGIKKLTTDYSSGYPHFVHLISKYSCLKAIDNNRQVVELDDFNFAIQKCIDDSDYSLRKAYEKAVKSSGKENKFTNVLHACASIDTAEKQYFNPKEIAKMYNKIYKSSVSEESVRYNLGMLCRGERGEILEKKQKSTPPEYFFKNPLMKAYIKLQLHVKYSQNH